MKPVTIGLIGLGTVGTGVARLLTEHPDRLARRAGRPFREVVNETLRRGLASRRVALQRQSFKITARDLGDLKPGLSLDNVAELVEHVEGSLYR